MKNILFVFSILLGSISMIAYADVNVDGYYRKDGTYVAPHHRSDPNGTTRDNWSTKGNVNPYTGEKGTKNPDQDGSVFSNPDSY